MNKKILSAVLALSMLGQSAFAMTLKEFVQTNLSDYTVTDGVFDYSTFVEKMNEANGTNNPTEIQATITAGVAKDGNNTYSSKVSTTSSKFDYKVTLDMENVNSAYNTLYNTASTAISLLANSGDPSVAALDSSSVTGTFTVVAEYDPELSFETSNFSFSQDGVADGDSIFTWDSTPVVNTDDNTVTFNFTANTTVAAINATLDSASGRYTALNDLTMELADVVANRKSKNLVVEVSLTEAYIELTEAAAATYGRVDFASNEAKATVYVESDSGNRGGLSMPSTAPSTVKPIATIVVDGVETPVEVTTTNGVHTVDISAIEAPSKDGYTFDGWYLDPTFLTPVDGTIQITENTYIYAKFVNITAPANLISDDHIVYIAGYPDGEVKPNANITREEVVAAFYRLLDPAYKATIETDTHSFPDVEADRWSNTSIATMANGGYIVGDENGYFNPANPITRAEFATIAVKFAEASSDSTANYFSDIDGHWAYNSILRAANSYYWVSGYEDGTFKPNAHITRAEAMTIINRMLIRYGDVTSDYAKQWPDVSASDWYYSNIIEATTEHDYTRNADGWNETWITAEEADANAEVSEEAESTDATESTEATEATDSTDAAASEEAADTTAEGEETADVTDGEETAATAENAEAAEDTDTADTTDTTEAEGEEATESTDAADTADTTEAAE